MKLTKPEREAAEEMRAMLNGPSYCAYCGKLVPDGGPVCDPYCKIPLPPRKIPDKKLKPRRAQDEGPMELEQIDKAQGKLL